MNPAEPKDVEELELDLLLEAVVRHYGYDFRNYARGSLRRRVRLVMDDERVTTLSDLQGRLLRDPRCFRRFITRLSVHVTSMFRDPQIYLAFRRVIVPWLRTYPFVRIWHAGCSTGEEVYSLAILLREEGLYERCLLYATDINDEIVQQAKHGIFPLSAMRQYISNYHKAGGTQDFSDYYVADHENAIMRDSLRDNLVFSQHSLVTDGSFNEFHVIFCRNVLIYFDQQLRERVHDLLYDSLVRLGVLALGLKETIDFTPHSGAYESIDADHRLYRRVR